ncbi:hypothetical protein A943_08360 [Bacillus sp. CPSM8]|nr:hypothetical protein A943_08360 [Bacillus sp. CPSM8]KUL09889.1 hypothetical protein LI7559_10860 [Bacillus licheniformis LMG 7559]KUL15870.1 hypothetical protein LI6934_18415 [Bacillus licheniformis LMG 6934]BCE08133.1 hypothetical protein RSC1_04290 [Bacillus paralicheniformis]BCE09952.1 hypothetical protein RSC2_01748 [Bacillus paralicheniformis]
MKREEAVAENRHVLKPFGPHSHENESAGGYMEENS